MASNSTKSKTTKTRKRTGPRKNPFLSVEKELTAQLKDLNLPIDLDVVEEVQGEIYRTVMDQINDPQKLAKVYKQVLVRKQEQERQRIDAILNQVDGDSPNPEKQATGATG
jgi:protein-arginine kinase